MRAALAAVVAALLLLTACGDGDGDGTLPTLPSAPASSTGAAATTDAAATTEAATSTEDATTEAPPAETVTVGETTTEDATTAGPPAETVTVTETTTEPATAEAPPETVTEASTETTPERDLVADKRLAVAGLVMRGDLPTGLGFKGLSPPGAPSRCFAAAARKLRPVGSATGRQFVGNRSRSLVTSLSWSFADEETASQALAAIGDASAVACFGKATARGATPTAKYLGATVLDFATVGDETGAYRAEFRLQGTTLIADYVFVRTARVVTAAAFENTDAPPKESTTQAVLEQVVDRVRDAG